MNKNAVWRRAMDRFIIEQPCWVHHSGFDNADRADTPRDCQMAAKRRARIAGSVVRGLLIQVSWWYSALKKYC